MQKNSFIQWMCTELLEMFADEELVDNYLSDNEKKPSLRTGLPSSCQLHLKAEGHFQSVLEQGVSFCDESYYSAL